MSAQKWMRGRKRLGLGLGLLAGVSLADAGCRQRGVCDDVEGSCLALRVEGDLGALDALRTTLSLEAGAMKVGDSAGAELPVTLRIVPPAETPSSLVRAVGVTAVQQMVDVASAQTGADFVWPDGAHIEATLQLVRPGGEQDMAVPPADMGSDMRTPPVDDMRGATDMQPPADMATPPAPTLRWTPEATTSRNELYAVWTGATNQAQAVGQTGTALLRQMDGNWRTENSGATANLYGTTGFTGASGWAVGDGSTARRRDAVTGVWTADAAGLTSGLHGVTPGTATGELWAAGDDGKVWHRTGSGTAAGTWQAPEQALPAGRTVYGVAQAGGVVFAVGDLGWVAVRKDTGGGAKWQPAYQYPMLSGMMGSPRGSLFGVFAFDKDNAVAVGTAGYVMRYTGGAWQTAAQKVDAPADNELNSVWGVSPARFWVVGYNGRLIRVEGTKTTALYTNENADLFGISGLSQSDIYVVGASRMPNGSLILHGTPMTP